MLPQAAYEDPQSSRLTPPNAGKAANRCSPNSLPCCRRVPRREVLPTPMTWLRASSSVHSVLRFWPVLEYDNVCDAHQTTLRRAPPCLSSRIFLLVSTTAFLMLFKQQLLPVWQHAVFYQIKICIVNRKFATHYALQTTRGLSPRADRECPCEFAREGRACRVRSRCGHSGGTRLSRPFPLRSLGRDALVASVPLAGYERTVPTR